MLKLSNHSMKRHEETMKKKIIEIKKSNECNKKL